MSEETTVLVVGAEALPSGLLAELEAKGVFIEAATDGHIPASLVAVAPDLVLVMGPEPLGEVVLAVRESDQDVPIVAVADRLLHRGLRQKYREALAAIVPQDLPVRALAHRLMTLARRAAQGEALVQQASLGPQAGAPSIGSVPSGTAPAQKPVPLKDRLQAMPRPKPAAAPSAPAPPPLDHTSAPAKSAAVTKPTTVAPELIESARQVSRPGSAPAPSFDATEESPTQAFEVPDDIRKQARGSVPPETVRNPSAPEILARTSEAELLVRAELEARQRSSSSGEESPAFVPPPRPARPPIPATLLGVAPPGLGAPNPTSAFAPTLPAPAPELRGVLAEPGGWAARLSRLAAPQTWPPALFWSVVALPVLLLSTGLWLALRASTPEPAFASPEPALAAATAANPVAPLAPTAPGLGEKAATAALERVRPNEDLPWPSCEEVVLRDDAATAAWDATAFWKGARRALVQGNVETAHELMCRAVTKDPAGAAAEALVGFYLGRHAVARADRVLSGILAVDGARRTVRELESDVLNQKGEQEEALRVLLGTLRLEPGDAAKRGAVSRKFTAEAALALKSGDLPLAERLLRRAVLLQPTNDAATRRLGEVLLKSGSLEAAR